MAREQPKKEKLSKRMRKAYRRGYVQGFEDSKKANSGRGYSGAYGYRKGAKNRRKSDKYIKQYERRK